MSFSVLLIGCNKETPIQTDIDLTRYTVGNKLIMDYSKDMKNSVTLLYTSDTDEELEDAIKEMSKEMTPACVTKMISMKDIYRNYRNYIVYVSNVHYGLAEWQKDNLARICIEMTVRDTGELVYVEYKINSEGKIEDFDMW